MSVYALVEERSGTWSVVDKSQGTPAEWNGEVLSGMDHYEAGLALYRLNVEAVKRAMSDRRSLRDRMSR